MRKIYIYSDEDEDILMRLNKAGPHFVSKFQFILKYIKDEGNILCEPYVKHFSVEKYKQFYELRLRSAGNMMRIIYIEKEGSLILLYAFSKRDRRDTQKALEHSLKILQNMSDDNLKEV